MANIDTLIPFTSGLAKGISAYSTDVDVVNMIHIASPGGRSAMYLTPIKGSVLRNTATPLGGNGCRGIWIASTGPDNNFTIYVVFGNTLYRYNRSYNLIRIGSFSNKTSNVSFAENQDQSATNNKGFVCDGTSVYTWNLKASDSEVSNSLEEIPSLPMVNGSTNERAIASYITYNRYRLIMTCANTNQWYYSGINDAIFSNTGWETTESNPDKTVRAITHANNIWVFSLYSYDIFSYTGSSTDPYDVGSGATGKIGCRSGDSVAAFGDYLFWYGQGENSNDAIYMSDAGGNISKVTTAEIETILRKWKYSNTSKAFAYSDEGLTFYVITSKDDNETLCYCVETKLWTHRSTSNNGKRMYWDISQIVRGYQNEMFAVTNDKNIIASIDYTNCVDHNGYPISREWSSPVIIDNLDLFMLKELKVDIDVGTTLTQTQPEIYLQLSWNGGKTSGERKLRKLGSTGSYNKQIAFYALGAGRNLVIRIGSSSPTPIAMYQLRLVTEGAGRT